LGSAVRTPGLTEEDGGERSPFARRELERFKQRIGYREPGGGEVLTRGVAAAWPDPGSLPGLGHWSGCGRSGWTTTSDGVYREGGEHGLAQRVWDLRAEEQRLMLRIAVSSTGTRAARRHLLRTTTATNMSLSDFPARRGPGDLGDLAVAIGADCLVWSYHNVCFELKRDSSTIDLTRVARALQSHAERHLVDRVIDHAPKIARVEVSPMKVRVGEPLTIRLHLAAGQEVQHMQADWRQVGQALGARGVENPTALRFELEGRSPGRSEVELHVVDRRTLLSTRVTAQVEVVSPGHGSLPPL
jgi:hypothetical protein